ncbi:UNVERIFIED_CONTAM: hypothetical protein H355_007413 [Colinus virginianus]|nr:hypothetical protein H355_007413 [Colinus virginianus]
MAPANRAEKTFIMVKPDGVQRGLVNEVVAKFERRGYKLVALKMTRPAEELLEEHYADLKAKPFFPGLVAYMTSGPVVCMVWEGTDVVKQGRKMLGETRPLDSSPGKPGLGGVPSTLGEGSWSAHVVRMYKLSIPRMQRPENTIFTVQAPWYTCMRCVHPLARTCVSALSLGAGTLRGDFCIDVGRNLVHGSDSVESARKEITLWFTPEEICDWKPAQSEWIYE